MSLMLGGRRDAVEEQMDTRLLQYHLVDEARMTLGYLEQAIGEARKELESRSLQACEKVFLAWKLAVRLLLTVYLLHMTRQGPLSIKEVERLEKVKAIAREDAVIRPVVTTSNVVKVLRYLREKTASPFREIAHDLLEGQVEGEKLRSLVFRLHSAFYEGSAGLAGFVDDGEAMEYVEKVLEEIERLKERIVSLLRP